jgi:hypothetical protein
MIDFSFARGGGGGARHGCPGGDVDREMFCWGAIGGAREGMGGGDSLVISSVDFRLLLGSRATGLLMSSGKRKEFIAVTFERGDGGRGAESELIVKQRNKCQRPGCSTYLCVWFDDCS